MDMGSGSIPLWDPEYDRARAREIEPEPISRQHCALFTATCALCRMAKRIHDHDLEEIDR